jgi:hypothetical protein
MLETAESCTLCPCDTVFSVHKSFCHLCLISLSRRGHPGPHCGTQAALVSASHPDYLILAVVPLAWHGRDEVLWRHRHLMI